MTSFVIGMREICGQADRWHRKRCDPYPREVSAAEGQVVAEPYPRGL